MPYFKIIALYYRGGSSKQSSKQIETEIILKLQVWRSPNFVHMILKTFTFQWDYNGLCGIYIRCTTVAMVTITNKMFIFCVICA